MKKPSMLRGKQAEESFVSTQRNFLKFQERKKKTQKKLKERNPENSHHQELCYWLAQNNLVLKHFIPFVYFKGFPVGVSTLWAATTKIKCSLSENGANYIHVLFKWSLLSWCQWILKSVWVSTMGLWEFSWAWDHGREANLIPMSSPLSWY